MDENNLFLTEAMAYFNLAASYEHLNKYESAIKSYEIAKHIALLHLGDHHPLYATISEN